MTKSRLGSAIPVLFMGMFLACSGCGASTEEAKDEYDEKSLSVGDEVQLGGVVVRFSSAESWKESLAVVLEFVNMTEGQVFRPTVSIDDARDNFGNELVASGVYTADNEFRPGESRKVLVIIHNKIETATNHEWDVIVKTAVEERKAIRLSFSKSQFLETPSPSLREFVKAAMEKAVNKVVDEEVYVFSRAVSGFTLKFLDAKEDSLLESIRSKTAEEENALLRNAFEQMEELLSESAGKRAASLESEIEAMEAESGMQFPDLKSRAMDKFDQGAKKEIERFRKSVGD